MASIPKEIDISMEFTVTAPIKIRTVTNWQAYSATVDVYASDKSMKKAKRFVKKVAKLCARYGYQMEEKHDMQDLCAGQQEGTGCC